MDKIDIDRRLEEHIDVLADIEHERWSHWQRYLHGKGTREADGSITLPAELVAQWEHQIATPFSGLSEKEKESDRDQVRKYLPAVAEILGSED